ncbi:MAG: 50S ribosomal protein L18 [Candidatus Woesearchaeota archaeon]|nr:50S ribosomal protein L18 [Candidatus Woesearchaeota archaeon]
MKSTKVRTIEYRRKREGRTNYRKRIELFKSNKPRLIVRKSIRGISAQIAEFNPKGDVILASANSNELKKYGFKTIKGNIVSAYFVGLLIGKKATAKGIREAILDIGINTSTKGSRIYAVVKGAIESGLKVPVSEEMLPSQNRLEGRHIENWAKESRSKSKEAFSLYEKNNIKIDEISKYFNDIKKRILTEYGG